MLALFLVGINKNLVTSKKGDYIANNIMNKSKKHIAGFSEHPETKV